MAIWQNQVQDSTASQFFPITLDISGFSYVSADGSSQVADTFKNSARYTAPSLYATPFFVTDIQSANYTPAFAGQNLLPKQDGGISLLLDQNFLSTQQAQWRTSRKVQLTDFSFVADQLDTDSVSVSLSFNQLPSQTEAASELVTSLAIVQAFTSYSLSVCLTYTAAQGDTTNVIPVNAFIRQKAYPYKALTEAQALTGVAASTGDEGCQSVTLDTDDLVLLMDLQNYAELVFDLVPTESDLENGAYTVELLNLQLMATPKVPRNVTKTFGGWGDKYSAANIGFGIVIALLIVAILAAAVLFIINQNRLQQVRAKMLAI